MSAGLSGYYSNPIFRPGVGVRVGAVNASFRYYRTEFDVDFDPGLADDVKLCVEALTAGASVDDPALSSAGRQHIHELLTVLDRFGFLTDTGWNSADTGLSGRAFWNELSGLNQQARAKFPFPFSSTLGAEPVSRDTLILYATQYYHVVLNGPRIIAGALAHATRPSTREILQHFLQEETGHDLLLAEALAGAGVTSAMVHDSVPLPETFALISYLQVLADQEPLSFAGTVFLMEQENIEFHDHFVRACENACLGESFWGPIRRHAHINDGGDHGNISAQLLEDVDIVSHEEAIVVKKHLIGLIECLSEIDCALHGNALKGEKLQG